MRPAAVEPSLTSIAHVVVFSELSPRAKAQYARFVIENNVQFAKRPSDGRYVANIRIAMPTSAIDMEPLCLHRKISSDVVAAPAEPDDNHQLESAIDSDLNSDADDDEIPEHLQRYRAVIHQFGERILQRKCAGTYTIESKLVRLINEIYDARAEDSASTDSGALSTSFTSFVWLHLTNCFGLKSLVEQQAIELLEGLAAHDTRRDVELFSRFLVGTYDASALAFFLWARDAAQQELASATARFRPTTAASARSRNSVSRSVHRRRVSGISVRTTPCWLTKQQIESIAVRVFGSKTEDAFLQFAHDVRAYVTQQASVRDTIELLELQEFYTLAIETHQHIQDQQSTGQDPTMRSPVSLGLSSNRARAGEGEPCESPSPSPLPPPPVPRTFGSTVHAPPVPPIQRPMPFASAKANRAQQPPPTRLYEPLRAPPLRQHQAEDEVQARLTSLLSRMEERHKQ